MNQLEKAVARFSNAGDILNHLAEHDILLPQRDDLEAYLAMHPDLSGLLDEMCTKVRVAIGSTAELSLEKYSDPEIDDSYLTLYVRQESYPPDIIDRIDAVCADFHRRLEVVSGYFLVTTDFRRPRGHDVV